MIALKITIAAAALLALAGCIAEPYGGSGYYAGAPAYYGDPGYGVGVYGGGVDVGVYDVHPNGDRGGGGERR